MNSNQNFRLKLLPSGLELIVEVGSAAVGTGMETYENN